MIITKSSPKDTNAALKPELNRGESDLISEISTNSYDLGPIKQQTIGNDPIAVPFPRIDDIYSSISHSDDESSEPLELSDSGKSDNGDFETTSGSLKIVNVPIKTPNIAAAPVKADMKPTNSFDTDVAAIQSENVTVPTERSSTGDHPVPTKPAPVLIRNAEQKSAQTKTQIENDVKRNLQSMRPIPLSAAPVLVKQLSSIEAIPKNSPPRVSVESSGEVTKRQVPSKPAPVLSKSNRPGSLPGEQEPVVQILPQTPLEQYAAPDNMPSRKSNNLVSEVAKRFASKAADPGDKSAQTATVWTPKIQTTTSIYQELEKNKVESEAKIKKLEQLLIDEQAKSTHLLSLKVENDSLKIQTKTQEATIEKLQQAILEAGSKATLSRALDNVQPVELSLPKTKVKVGEPGYVLDRRSIIEKRARGDSNSGEGRGRPTSMAFQAPSVNMMSMLPLLTNTTLGLESNTVDALIAYFNAADSDPKKLQHVNDWAPKFLNQAKKLAEQFDLNQEELTMAKEKVLEVEQQLKSLKLKYESGIGVKSRAGFNEVQSLMSNDFLKRETLNEEDKFLAMTTRKIIDLIPFDNLVGCQKNELAADLDALYNLNYSLQQSVNKFTHEKNSLVTINLSLAQELQEAQGNYSKLSSELQKIKEAAISEKSAAEKIQAEYEQTFKDLNLMINNLTIENGKLNQKSSTDIVIQQKKYQEKIMHLEMVNALDQNEKKNLEETLKKVFVTNQVQLHLEAEINKVKQDRDTMQLRSNELQSKGKQEIESLQSRLKDLEYQFKKERESMATIKTQKESLNQSLQKEQGAKELLLSENNQLQIQLKESISNQTKEVQDLLRLKSELHVSNQKKSTQEEFIKNLEQKLTSSQQAYFDISKEHKILSDKWNECQQVIDAVPKLMQTNADYEKASEEYKLLTETKLKEAESRLLALMEEITTLKTTISIQKKELKKAKKHIKDLEMAIQARTAEAERKQQEGLVLDPQRREAIKDKFLRMKTHYESKIQNLNLQLLKQDEKRSSNHYTARLLKAKYRFMKAEELHLYEEVAFNDQILRQIKEIY